MQLKTMHRKREKFKSTTIEKDCQNLVGVFAGIYLDRK